MNRPGDSQTPPSPKEQPQQPVQVVPPTYRSLYLILYNAVSALLWAVVLGRTALILGLRGRRHTYAGVGEFAKWTQTLAGLEVLHAATGLVRAPLPTTAMQVASRYLLVWAIVDQFPHATAPALAYSTMLLAWACSEVVRYSYFAAHLATGAVPAWLVWLRYNAFYVLYPMGISSECWLVWLSMAPARGRWPGAEWGLRLVLLIYIPGSYILFTHMMAQRRKVMRATDPKKGR